MKYKTAVLCLKLLTCLIVQRSFDNLLSDDPLSENLFEVLWHDEALYVDKSSINYFSKKISFWSDMGPIWPKITQAYITLTALEIFRNILG